jgi:hypothetical protein
VGHVHHDSPVGPAVSGAAVNLDDETPIIGDDDDDEDSKFRAFAFESLNAMGPMEAIFEDRNVDERAMMTTDRKGATNTDPAAADAVEKGKSAAAAAEMGKQR